MRPELTFIEFGRFNQTAYRDGRVLPTISNVVDTLKSFLNDMLQEKFVAPPNKFPRLIACMVGELETLAALVAPTAQESALSNILLSHVEGLEETVVATLALRESSVVTAPPKQLHLADKAAPSPADAVITCSLAALSLLLIDHEDDDGMFDGTERVRGLREAVTEAVQAMKPSQLKLFKYTLLQTAMADDGPGAAFVDPAISAINAWIKQQAAPGKAGHDSQLWSLSHDVVVAVLREADARRGDGSCNHALAAKVADLAGRVQKLGEPDFRQLTHNALTICLQDDEAEVDASLENAAIMGNWLHKISVYPRRVVLA